MTIIPSGQSAEPAERAEKAHCGECGEPIEFCTQTGWWLHMTPVPFRVAYPRASK